MVKLVKPHLHRVRKLRALGVLPPVGSPSGSAGQAVESTPAKKATSRKSTKSK
jgi:hypothetical protein